MILSFPAWRRGEVRLCGGLIDEALLRGHEVELLWQPEDKPGEAVEAEALRARWPKAHVLRLGASIGTFLKPLAALRDEAADVSLDYCLNHLHCPPPRNVKLMTFYSQWERAKWLEAAQFKWKRQVTCKTVVTGDAALDGLRLCEPASTRARFGLGRKPIILLFALKFTVPHLWRKLYKHTAYRATVKAIRKYCDELGALLIIKSRRKHDDPGWLGDYADRLLYDDDGGLYPSLSYELLLVSSLSISWQSGAVYESVAAGVPHISIRIGHPHLDSYKAAGFLFGNYVMENSPNRWSGVVTSVGWREAPRFFRNATGVPPLSHVAHHEFLRKFLGSNPFGASARVLDAVEQL